MSDNIPFEIQVEIMKWLPVKSLIQFRSVSKTWKSMIDSSGFVAEYSRQHTHMQHMLVQYEDVTDGEITYISIVDDDTFPTRSVSLPRPNMPEVHRVVGCSHGVFCLYLFDRVRGTGKAVLWNPSIRKTIDVVLPNVANGETYETVLGFGVCRETNDMKIVKINHIVSWSDVEGASCIPWQVQVFNLSTRTWRSLGGNLPYKLVHFHGLLLSHRCLVVVIDGVIYWLVTDRVTLCNLIISFDITSEGFGEINLPNGLARPPFGHGLFMLKLRGSLVLVDRGYKAYDVWLMEGGVPKSFTKLSTFNPYTHVPDVAMPLGFRKSGEHLIGNAERGAMLRGCLVVYDPLSKCINITGIEGLLYSIFVHPYMETLFLLDQPNRTVHN